MFKADLPASWQHGREHNQLTNSQHESLHAPSSQGLYALLLMKRGMEASLCPPVRSNFIIVLENASCCLKNLSYLFP